MQHRQYVVKGQPWLGGGGKGDGGGGNRNQTLSANVANCSA